ncbi:hypothetical protein Ahy_A06g026765 isoform A [Arachis hypogaea]|uniref:Uncharacterized protein n=1 Tax=Arachis hypogaea TaxID=3818 RepID=A0A445CLH7_ARAHY|nr:hypothetical protein Ahy_A06g026765 isoform A [Arachis hypogaea]
MKKNCVDDLDWSQSAFCFELYDHNPNHKLGEWVKHIKLIFSHAKNVLDLLDCESSRNQVHYFGLQQIHY